MGVIYVCQDEKCEKYNQLLSFDDMRLHIINDHGIDVKTVPFTETYISFLDMGKYYQNTSECRFKNGYAFNKQVIGKRDGYK